MFAQQEYNSCWVLLFVDIRAHMHRSSAALAHLHVWLNRRADYCAYSSPPSLASASRRILALCEESDSRMVLISRQIGPERAATAVCSPHGMSVQLDIPTFISAPPPSRDVGFLAHAEVKPLHVVFSWVGGIGRVALATKGYHIDCPHYDLFFLAHFSTIIA